MKKFLIFPVLIGVLILTGCGKVDDKVVEEVEIQGEEMAEENLNNDKQEVEQIKNEDTSESFVTSEMVDQKVEVKESEFKKEVNNEKEDNKDEIDVKKEDPINQEEVNDDSNVKKVTENEEENVDKSTSTKDVSKDGMMSKDFAENLSKCSPDKESFKHPFSGEKLNREIVGLDGDKCVYKEQMPGSMTMQCKYSKESLKKVADYHNKLANATSIKSKTVTISSGKSVTTTVVDGVEIDFSMNDILNKECTF